ncbi:MAG: glycoside hydrolase 100 family protein [Desulfofustis sp.]
MKTKQPAAEDAYAKARDLLMQCATADGFLASPTKQENYRRIWSRDGVITGLASLMSGDETLIEAFGKTLETLAGHQGPHGEIPSNVGITNDDVSYGGTAGRVDANLWFVIGAAEYAQQTGDEQFIDEMLPVLEKIMFLLGAWEYNNRGFLYVPATGDWADEYIHSGYVLYDQLLYLQALRSFALIQAKTNGSSDQNIVNKISTLRSMIRANFWVAADDNIPEHVYHEVLFKKGRDAADNCTQRYWLPFFSPHGYGYRFDAFANILASLLAVAKDEQIEAVDRYIENHAVPDELHLLPAFHPVIEQDDKDWKQLNVAFSYDFKNCPYAFHNGGLWPMLTGFYAADLARRGRFEAAGRYLDGIAAANSMELDEHSWGFAEFVNGKDFTPGGNVGQCWSASAYLMAFHGLQNKPVFSIT